MPNLSINKLVFIEPGLTPYRVPVFNKLAQRFNEFEVCLLDYPGTRWQQFNHTIEFDYQVVPGRNWRVPGTNWYFDLGVHILGYLRKKKPEAIILAGYSSLGSLFTGIYARNQAVPLVMSADSHLGSISSHHWIIQAYRRMVMSTVDACAVASLASMKLMKSLGAQEGSVFWAPYGLDSNYFARKSQLAPNEIAERQLSMGVSGRRVLLYVGRLAPEKRVDLLLSAYAGLPEEILKSTALIIAGDGPLRTKLEQQSREITTGKVVFTGFLEQAELIPYYSLANIFVLPSEREPWGMVVNEAMACGLPIILSDACGTAGEAVLDGVNGLIFPSGDRAALIVDMKTLLTDLARCKEMGAESKRLVQRFSPENAVLGFCQALDYAIRKKLRRPV